MKPTLLLLAFTSSLFAAERPEVTVPRQTSGDTAVQPKWEETLAITVGTKDADIVGSDQRAIQAVAIARINYGVASVIGFEALPTNLNLSEKTPSFSDRMRVS